MAIEQDNAAYVPPRTAYGRYIHERGTRTLLIWFGALAVAWYVYSAVHTHMMLQVKWPQLSPDPAGLTVVGIQDKDRPGFRHRLEARESNHSWQIRLAQDEGEGDSDAQEPTPEQQDRGSATDPGAAHRGNSGAVVDVEDVLRTCPVVLVGRNFSGASIHEGWDEFLNKAFYKLDLDLTDEGRSRYWQFSHLHDNERIAFILNNLVIACPRMSNMDVGTLTIEPMWVKSDAEMLRDYIEKHKQ